MAQNTEIQQAWSDFIAFFHKHKNVFQDLSPNQPAPPTQPGNVTLPGTSILAGGVVNPPHPPGLTPKLPGGITIADSTYGLVSADATLFDNPDLEGETFGLIAARPNFGDPNSQPSYTILINCQNASSPVGMWHDYSRTVAAPAGSAVPYVLAPSISKPGPHPNDPVVTDNDWIAHAHSTNVNLDTWDKAIAWLKNFKKPTYIPPTKMI